MWEHCPEMLFVTWQMGDSILYKKEFEMELRGSDYAVRLGLKVTVKK